MRMAFKTFIDGHIRCEDYDLGPVERWATPNDVPAALRQAINSSRQSGLTLEMISKIYEMPREWVELFTTDAAGRA